MRFVNGHLNDNGPISISVVIPVHNRSDLISGTLNSVAQQDASQVEVIVIDDGSIDQTVESIDGHPCCLKLIRQFNAGPAAARNTGIAAASGEYIAFLDSDDLWFPWTLKTYRHVIEEYGYPAFVAGRRTASATRRS